MKSKIGKMTRQVLSAVLLLSILLTGWENKYTAYAENGDNAGTANPESSEAAADEQMENSTVRLSNTKFPDMANLTEEEAEMLQAATDMLSLASLERTENSYSAYGNCLSMENTSGWN